MINFYEVLPKQLKKKPKFDKATNMELPFRCAVVGSSGAGKTNWLLNLIKLQASNFERIIVCSKNVTEPLYQFLAMKIGDQIEFYEGVENIPPVDTFKDSNESILMVFDDLMLEKDQKL